MWLTLKKRQNLATGQVEVHVVKFALPDRDQDRQDQ